MKKLILIAVLSLVSLVGFGQDKREQNVLDFLNAERIALGTKTVTWDNSIEDNKDYEFKVAKTKQINTIHLLLDKKLVYNGLTTKELAEMQDRLIVENKRFGVDVEENAKNDFYKKCKIFFYELTPEGEKWYSEANNELITKENYIEVIAVLISN